MSPDGARNQEQLCWRGPAAIYWTAISQLKRGIERVAARQQTAGNDMSTEAEESTLLGAVTRQRLVKT
jgi:hypothetical protein